VQEVEAVGQLQQAVLDLKLCGEVRVRVSSQVGGEEKV
jgi:hypothetical protein